MVTVLSAGDRRLVTLEACQQMASVHFCMPQSYKPNARQKPCSKTRAYGGTKGMIGATHHSLEPREPKHRHCYIIGRMCEWHGHILIAAGPPCSHMASKNLNAGAVRLGRSCTGRRHVRFWRFEDRREEGELRAGCGGAGTSHTFGRGLPRVAVRGKCGARILGGM